MIFALGYICGIVTAGLIFLILAFFRAPIERIIKITETMAHTAGPKPKGAIIMPKDEAEITRQEIIAKNKREGKDTNISELR